MKTFKELTIVTPNKPGKLAEALRAVAQAGANLKALDSSSGYDMNMVRMVVSDAPAARRALDKLGYNITEATVLGIQITDKPGQLAKVASTLARGKVNINYMYATAVQDGKEALVIFHLSDTTAGERALKSAGIQ